MSDQGAFETPEDRIRRAMMMRQDQMSAFERRQDNPLMQYFGDRAQSHGRWAGFHGASAAIGGVGAALPPMSIPLGAAAAFQASQAYQANQERQRALQAQQMWGNAAPRLSPPMPRDVNGYE